MVRGKGYRVEKIRRGSRVGREVKRVRLFLLALYVFGLDTVRELGLGKKTMLTRALLHYTLLYSYIYAAWYPHAPTRDGSNGHEKIECWIQSFGAFYFKC